jgi:mono/diheme cytochrome c family protein
MVKNKVLFVMLAVVIIPAVLTSCKKASGDYPGDSYTWDMNYSRAYEPYALHPELANGMSAMTPVANTVPYVGNAVAGVTADSLTSALNLPYAIPNTPEGYILAATANKNPFTINDKEVVATGKHYYDIYCAVCHGAAGDGKGYIVTEGKYTAAPPSYFDPMYMAMTEGTMFHSVTYGRNAMQPYSYALSNYAAGQAAPAAADTTAAK